MKNVITLKPQKQKRKNKKRGNEKTLHDFMFPEKKILEILDFFQ